ncbi:SURF1 family protein [Nocardiopsis kunsanensis]|uniref:SURF1-like protein n=1 Tax=Nocardiopsis kunsanensis TaxID=141693 RepID=A0A919CH84_9ACTN|nr:SURF1 family protein [Nocardiopsis kunsanensis]GHD25314.1 SURF1-like protein [Nocardiopsis kunsanensis]
MRSPLLTPRWLGIHLAALIVLAVCVAGTAWQVVRSFEPDRETITNPIEDLAEARPLGRDFEPGEYMHPDRIANNAVQTQGQYEAQDQLLVPRVMDGTEGYDVVLPLIADDGAAIAINRGWTEDPGTVPEPPGGRISVTGWLLPAQTAEDGIRPMEMPEGQVERIAPAVLLQEWEYEAMYEGYIVVPGSDPANEGLEPVPPPEPPTGVTVNWRSLSYSVQWGMFGVSALVFWIILMRRELTEARTPEEERASEEDGSDGQPVRAGS